MVYLLGIPLIILASILQSVVVNDIRILNGRADLVLLILVCTALYYRVKPALFLGFLGGLFLDLLSGLPLGTTSIQLLLVVFMISFTENRFWRTNLLIVEIVTLASSLMFHLMGAGVIFLTGSGITFLEAFTRIIIPSTFLNLIFVLPLAFIFHRLRNELEEEEEWMP